MISGASKADAGDAERFSSAHEALRSDPSVQFNLTPPSPQAKPPAWLEAAFRWLDDYVFAPIGAALKWLAGFFPDAAYARVFLWVVIAIGVALLAWALFNRLRHGEWRLRLRPRRRTDSAGGEAEDEWTPEVVGARSWLEEADELARQGQFAAAIHHLLFRSIDDIANRRPALVRPALTSRELAASPAIPCGARALFASIARLVERSLFGGQPVAECDWLQARSAYSNFALPAAWRA